MRLDEIAYHSGDIFLPKSLKQVLDTDIVGSSKKTFYLSGWTILHFMSGILFGYIFLQWYPDTTATNYYYKMFVLHTIWELWQMLIGMAHPYNLTGPSNLVDILVDTIAFMVGVFLNKQIG